MHKLRSLVRWDTSERIILGLTGDFIARDEWFKVVGLMVTVSPIALLLRGLEPNKAVLPYQFGVSRSESTGKARGLSLVDWSRVTPQQVSQALYEFNFSCKSNLSEMKQARGFSDAMTAQLELKSVPLLGSASCKDLFPMLDRTPSKRDRAE